MRDNNLKLRTKDYALSVISLHFDVSRILERWKHQRKGFGSRFRNGARVTNTSFLRSRPRLFPCFISHMPLATRHVYPLSICLYPLEPHKHGICRFFFLLLPLPAPPPLVSPTQNGVVSGNFRITGREHGSQGRNDEYDHGKYWHPLVERRF